jgi:Tfp pilus assembly PilM family ATPase
MARSCGIRLGPRRYEIVVLDGSPKRHKIAAFCAGEFPLDAEDPIPAMITELKEAAKKHNVPREHVGLVIDSGTAAFRRVKLPFSDEAKIEQVLKFEVESQLPQWSIDDVVIDFESLAEDANSCELLVTAVPKQVIKASLGVLEKSGIEAFEVELETSAMVNAAMAADICHMDDAQLLVHVGDHSTSVVVMDAGQVREMRVIHIGALSSEIQGNVPAPAVAEDAEEEAPGILEPLEPSEVKRRVDQAIKRIRRELGRTISAARTIHSVDAIYVCGMELPGLIGSTVHEIPVHLLDCFDEDGGQPADGFGALVVAYGAALRELGGGFMNPSLRREELRYTGAFERVEFPLAVACLLLCTFLGVINILQFREREFLEKNGVLNWIRFSNSLMIGEPAKGKAGVLRDVPEDLKDYAELFEAKTGDLRPRDPDRTPVESIEYINANLQEKILQIQRDLGQDTGVQQPQSALVGMALVLGVLEENKAWRPSLRKVHSIYQPGKQGKTDTVKVVIDVTFFDDLSSLEATKDYEAFENTLETKPWFVSLDAKKNDELENGLGIFVRGLPITVDVSKYYAAQRPN